MVRPYGHGTAGYEVSYAVLIRPELDGTALPELPGTLILGEVFTLAAEGEARPGAPFWMVAGDGDGEVRYTPGAVGVRVGPEHRDGVLPHWMMWPETEAWPGPDPVPRLLLPREADTGTAGFRLDGDRVTGTVRLWADPRAGWPRPRRYTATVTGTRTPAGPTPAGVTASPPVPAAPAVAPRVTAEDRMELRSRAQSLVLERRYAEARPLLARAAASYAASASRPGAWPGRVVSDLTSLAFMTPYQALCALELGDYDGLLDCLLAAVDVRRTLTAVSSASGYGPRYEEEVRAGARILPGFVDAWRSRLAQDTARIDAVDASRPFHAALTLYLFEQGAHEDALVASEAGRARAFADLLSACGSRWPSRAGASAAPRLTRAALRSVLARHGRTVVEYAVHGDLLLIWVARPDGTLRTLGPLPATGLGELTARWSALAPDVVDDDSVRALDEVLRGLGALLWDPVPRSWLPSDPDETVTVVPHGDLLRVPFPALRTADGRFLVERHPVALLPALGVLPALHERRASRPPPSSRLLALVDPAPLPDPPDGGVPFAPLTWTRRRFPAIASLYPRAEVRTGEEAAVTALGGHRPPPSVVHFGTHAVTLDDDALDSFVALAATGGHDGRLRARDVLDLRVPGDVVVLSACRTGAGRVGADGVIGLSRSFLAAGPTTLVLTLCEVEEAAGFEISHGLHRLLAAGGCSPALALCRVQRELAAEVYRPHEWSPFLLYGLG
ncbi:CHAT domain-containing protein [Streptomyces fagopyri]|uniref:CHAT domain-containing protein n=1 Tax=Streptomyces fagopyri TaxID=2662397 RepID=UPI00380D1447